MLPHAGLNVNQVRQFSLKYEPWTAAYSQQGKIVTLELGWQKRKFHIHKSSGPELTSVNAEFDVNDITSFQDKFYATECFTDSGRVLIFNSKLVLIRSFKVGYKQSGRIAVTGKFLFITSLNENTVYRVEMPGAKKNKRAIITSGLHEPGEIASNGELVAVSCLKMHKVFVYDTEGCLQYIYGGEGLSSEQLHYPWGVAVDQKSRVIICDTDNCRLCFVSSQGHYIKEVALNSGIYPRGVVVTSPGHLLVVSSTGPAGVVAIYQY